MAEAMVTSLVTKLTEMAIDEAIAKCRPQFTVREEMRFIKEELSIMKAFLKDAEKKSVRGDAVKEWLAQVRDEAYKIEEVLEEFQVLMGVLRTRRPASYLHVRSVFLYLPSFFKQMGLRRRFHSQIRIIGKEVNHISRRRLQYNLEEGTNSSPSEETRRPNQVVSSHFEEEDDIVGIDKDVKKLKEWLLKEEAYHRTIISVIGMGGSGKTTLIKKVYKDVKENFDFHAWVSVSQSFLQKEILKRMLRGFHASREDPLPSTMEAMAEDELQEAIHNYLQGKRYVLVLDDIWDVDAWEEIKHALPNASMGMIVFTTRMANVASPIGETSYVHQLQPLPHELAWSLFCKKAFRTTIPENTCPEHLKQIGEAIVKRCSGLPLAIVAIGGLMSKKGTNQLEWNGILENLNYELNHNQALGALNNVLLTSYLYLPPCLKHCFLYSGMFPEDYRIKAKRLVRLWVAEGFIEDHPRNTPEEVAYDYLMQLIDRRMLQADESERDIGMIVCTMHDLLRDIAVYMSKKEDFGVVFTNQGNEGTGTDQTNETMQQLNNAINERVRRVAIHSASVSISTNVVGDRKARSFLMFSTEGFSSSTLRWMLTNLKLLRVLDLSGTKIEHLAGEVCGLVHLRYLSLRWTQVNELPAELYKLYNLQTLDVRNSKVANFPDRMEIAMFQQLRHLLLASLGEFRPTVIQVGMCDGRRINRNSMNKLQTLAGVEATDSLVSQLCYLTQLQKLSIYCVRREHCSDICAGMKKMQRLQILTLGAWGFDEVLDLEISPPPFNLQKIWLAGIMNHGRLPQWIGSQNCLHTIKLFNSRLREDAMSILAQLPSLVWLALQSNAYSERQMSWGAESSGGRLRFPKLRTMLIMKLTELEEFSEVEEGTMMPCLRTLCFGELPKLKKLPSGFQHLKALKYLLFETMSSEFIERLRPQREDAVGEDNWMIQHIPSVWIREWVNGDYLYNEKLN